MADELTIRFRMKYVNGDVVWFEPERDESDVTKFTISGNQSLINIQTFDDTEFSLPINSIDRGDADSANGYLYVENINDDGYIDVVEDASGDYILARLYPGDSLFTQLGDGNNTLSIVASSGNMDALIISIDN